MEGEESQSPLAGQVAIVTGGGWNIGRAIALEFARAGARVVVAARRSELLAAVVAEIEAAGGAALAVATDVTLPEQVDELVRASTAHFGTIDILAACAGGGGAHAPIDQVPPQEWHSVVSTNLFGTFHCARAVLPRMRARDRGRILTFCGGGAFFPELGLNATAYASAKAAICRFTDQLQAELLETGIHVNCIQPGMVRDPEQLATVAELALFLASDAGSVIRGRVIAADDAWWRDPARVHAVEQTIHLYRLRRVDEG